MKGLSHNHTKFQDDQLNSSCETGGLLFSSPPPVFLRLHYYYTFIVQASPETLNDFSFNEIPCSGENGIYCAFCCISSEHKSQLCVKKSLFYYGISNNIYKRGDLCCFMGRKRIYPILKKYCTKISEADKVKHETSEM